MGTDVTASPQSVRRNIGYVPDSFGVYEDLSVVEYLHFSRPPIASREKRAGTVRTFRADGFEQQSRCRRWMRCRAA